MAIFVAISFLRINVTNSSELDRINERPAEWCKGLRSTMKVPGTNQTVDVLFRSEKEHLQLTPHRDKDVGKWRVGKSNHQSLLSVDHNFYSVPVRYAYQQLDVLVTAREVIMYAKGQEVSRHKRSFEQGRSFYEPSHYIPVFKKKPYAL